jgi:alpha-galactosidase
MKYCTWFDPEEAHPSSHLAREHPEWMLYIPEKEMGLVNFGLREVQDWFLEHIQQRIDQWGIHKLKWDHNIDPQPFWAAHDDPEHRGLLQLRHVRGVYRVWEELTRRNPRLVLENCSSGGRRFDLGTFGRAHIHHGSDFNFQDDIVRTQISGVNTVMPTHRVIHTCTWGGPDFPDTYVQSRFGGILRFSQDFASWPAEALARVKRHIGVYKQVRHLLKEDFYPLFPQPRSLEEWDGWQFHDPRTQEGVVMAFRMHGPEGSRRPYLRALEPGQQYRFEDPYSGVTRLESGRALLENGLHFVLEPNSASILRYWPTDAR